MHITMQIQIQLLEARIIAVDGTLTNPRLLVRSYVRMIDQPAQTPDVPELSLSGIIRPNLPSLRSQPSRDYRLIFFSRLGGALAVERAYTTSRENGISESAKGKPMHLVNLYKIETYDFARCRWNCVGRRNDQASAQFAMDQLVAQGFKARWIIRN